MSGTPIVPSDLDSPKKYNRIIAWLTGLLTLLLALFSFILSFNALTDLAAQHGISMPVLFPLIVEAGVVIFSLNALYRSLQGESAKVQWLLIIGSSLLAGVFNVLHARTDLVSRTIAAMPSLFLLLSFETFLGQVKLAVRRTQIVQGVEQLVALVQNQQATLQQLEADEQRLRTELTTLEAEANSLRSEISRLRQEKRTAEAFNLGTLDAANTVRAKGKAQALVALLDFYAQHPQASLNEAGEAIGRSKSTVSNYLEALDTAGRIRRDGHGVEVLS
jgi:hypothetical protein